MTEPENQQPPAPAEPPAESENPSREAAKWRRQLRETEVERDTLKSQVEKLHRQEVERLAGSRLSKADALWKAGAQLADLLDEEGAVDPEKVDAAVSNAVESLGLQVVSPLNNPATRGAYVPSEGHHTGNPSAEFTWDDLLKKQ